MNTKTKSLLLCFLVLILSIPYAQAQEAEDHGVDILPAKSVASDALYMDGSTSTHPPVRLTPDKSEIVHLDKEAGTIIVGNPTHLSVIADSAKTLILVPQTPGATYFTVLDHAGNVIMQRHAIVSSPKKKYIRIKRSCANAGEGACQANQVFYCPDMCHEIAVVGQEEEKSSTLDDVMGDIMGKAFEEATGESLGGEEPN